LLTGVLSILFYTQFFIKHNNSAYIVYYSQVESYPQIETYDEVTLKSIMGIFSTKDEALAYIKGVEDSKSLTKISLEDPDTSMIAIGILKNGDIVSVYYYELPNEEVQS
jgi:hypothetical protein